MPSLLQYYESVAAVRPHLPCFGVGFITLRNNKEPCFNINRALNSPMKDLSCACLVNFTNKMRTNKYGQSKNRGADFAGPDNLVKLADDQKM